MNKKTVSPTIAVMLLFAVAVAACGAYFIWYKAFQAGSQKEESIEIGKMMPEMKNPDVFIGTAEEVKKEHERMNVINEAIKKIKEKYGENITYSCREYTKGKMRYEILIKNAKDFKEVENETTNKTYSQLLGEHMYFLTLRLNAKEYTYYTSEEGTIYFEGMFDWYSFMAEES